MSLKKSNDGYTLIELIVVITLIGIMLFFAVPRFQNSIISDSTRTFSRWILTSVRNLKAAAVRDQKRFALNFDLDTGRIWITSEGMSEEDLQNAEQGSYRLPEDLRIMDVEFPVEGKITSGLAEINFYRGDYSDKAIIHVESGRRRQVSFLIEPFLPGAKLYEEYIGFET